MSGCNMGNFVRHNAGQFRFAVCGQQQPFVHVKISARESERVNLVGIDNLDVEGNFGI